MQSQQQVWLQILGLAIFAAGGAIIANDKVALHPTLILIVPALFSYLAGIWAWHDNAIRTLAKYITTRLQPDIQRILLAVAGEDGIPNSLLGWESFKFIEVKDVRGSEWPDRLLVVNRYGAAIAGGALCIGYWAWMVTHGGAKYTNWYAAGPLLAFDLVVLLAASAIVFIVTLRWWDFRNELSRR